MLSKFKQLSRIGGKIFIKKMIIGPTKLKLEKLYTRATKTLYKQPCPIENLRFVWVMAMPLVTLFFEFV